MGFKLFFLNLWTPNYLIRKELANLSEQTTSALKTLLAQYAPQEVPIYTEKPRESVDEIRANMGQTHRELVEKLQATLGHEQAVKQGREALFAVGENLGRQTRGKLGVGNKPADIEKAAKILYRILGINFTLQWQDNANAVATINRCALSEQYSALTCKVLSATDEGVIRGLQPNVAMHFEQYITGGCENCKAKIEFSKKENQA